MLSQLWNRHYNPSEWVGLQLGLSLYFAIAVGYAMRVYGESPIPVGICGWVDCNVLWGLGGKSVFVLIAAVSLVFYLRNRYMPLACLGLGLVSLFAFTVEESNGILSRGGMFTSLFFAQAAAFAVSYKKSNEESAITAVRYSVQIVAAAYWLAALSKLSISGVQWIVDGKFIPLQVIKSYSTHYFTFGDETFMEMGWRNVDQLVRYDLLVQMALLFSLVVEFLSPLAILGRRWALSVGAALFFMHVGIELIMNIYIETIGHPMIIVLINPVYIALLLVAGYWKKVKEVCGT